MSDNTAMALEARSWADKAKGLSITDKASCINASLLLRSIKGLRAEIEKWFAPHLEAAMETKRRAEAARKGLAVEQAAMEAPLIEAEGVVKRALLSWEQEQERIRHAEELRLQAIAQREAEALTLAAAAAMERDAVATGNAEMMREATAILDQPIDTPVISVATLKPRVEGVSYRDNWKSHPEIDVKTLARAVADGRAPASFLSVNLAAVNSFARATKGTQEVPGVRFYNDRQIAARG